MYKYRTMRLTYAVFPGALCEGDVHNVVVHVACVVLVQGAEATGRVLYRVAVSIRDGASGDMGAKTHLSYKHRSPEQTRTHNLEGAPPLLP